MKTLGEYLIGRKKADFARQLGVSASRLSQYLSGYRRPSYDKMIKVERLTSGEVTVQSWAQDIDGAGRADAGDPGESGKGHAQ